uniref:DUF6598 domain-containing protein n=1 Tax=Setaria italica TaxID=4555 RepID=K3ZZH7_SETIT
MDLLLDISGLLTDKKMNELEELHAKKEAEREGVDPDLIQDMLPDSVPDIDDPNLRLALVAAEQEVVQKMHKEVRAEGVDPNPFEISDYLQQVCPVMSMRAAPMDPYLVLTDPTRAVVMNEESNPVTIEAELKVKGSVESEDKYLIAAAETHSKLEVTLGEIVSSVEATIFIRVTDSTWPVGFHGQFTAHTASSNHKKVILIEFEGDGNMDHLRHAVSVETSGELIVSFKAWKGNEEAMRGEVVFKAEMAGRSFVLEWSNSIRSWSHAKQDLKVGSCSLGVLVAWSRVRPMCEELVPESQLRLCHF